MTTIKKIKLNKNILILFLFLVFFIFDLFSIFIMMHPHVEDNYRAYYISKKINSQEYYENEMHNKIDLQERLKSICAPSIRDKTC